MGQARTCCPGPCKSCCIFIFGLILLLFIVTFGIVPIIFKYSTEIQRNLIFPKWESQLANFTDPGEYGIEAARNFYLTVDQDENVTLGLWQILPTSQISNSSSIYDFEDSIRNNSNDILLYLHGNGANRALHHELYSKLRKYFQIFAPDYRGYADSTDLNLSEPNIVADTIFLYKWLKNQTSARIFVWGHSLGTGVGTHVVADLKKQQIWPSGLVLEAPFSSVTDVIKLHPIAKFFSWLPWFTSTFITPIDSNGFGFNSKKYILDVDCPIMIIHAKDDTIIPYQLATLLYDTAMEKRNLTAQGPISYHLLGEKGYDHMLILEAPEFEMFVEDFIEVCNNFTRRH